MEKKGKEAKKKKKKKKKTTKKNNLGISNKRKRAQVYRKKAT